MNRQFRYINMREIAGEYSKMLKTSDDVSVAQFEQVLICLGEVQKSGAMVYFRPANNDFTCNGQDFYETYSAAYQSENW